VPCHIPVTPSHNNIIDHTTSTKDRHDEPQAQDHQPRDRKQRQDNIRPGSDGRTDGQVEDQQIEIQRV
jgi:hypothetical protein